MKIILLENIPKLGKKYDIKNVSDGYALNFLIPKKLAVAATSQKIKEIENLKKQEELKNQKIQALFKEWAEKIKNTTLDFRLKTDKSGKTFGSVTKEDIAKQLEKTSGIKIEEKQIILDEHIKKVGDYVIKIKFSPEIETELKIHVLSE
ncbi:MAG TPA: 50S ribosomal protein L9 [Candidatus Paceibacterota bacterium]|jgi:large subunit ribosomal protein L9|nr:50S ribosomal protein L9 [Candidatus Paceibacterota bacterium]HQM34890.1 50S ribosomal protein L9 [Candidatus Paceibacterota bacterium]